MLGNRATLGRELALLPAFAGMAVKVETRFQVIVPGARFGGRLFTVAVRVIAGAPEPKVVVVPALDASVTVIGFTVNVIDFFCEGLVVEVAVIVTVQGAVIVAGGGVYVTLVVEPGIAVKVPQPGAEGKGNAPGAS